MLTPEEIENLAIELLKKKSYTPLTLPQIGAAINIPRKQLPVLRKRLGILLDSGRIAKVKGDRYCISAELGLVSGEISFNRSGGAWLRPEGSEVSYRIRHEDTGVALNGDTVLARVLLPRASKRARRYDDDGLNRYAKVIRVLKRKTNKVVGTLKQSRAGWHVMSDNPRFYYDIIVPDPAQSGLFPIPKAEDKVVVELFEWTQRHLNPTGKIVENLGKSHTPMAEYKGILAKFDLDETFPESVASEVARLPMDVSAKDMAGRLDLREAFTITIDPSDAKDFDDAISMRRGESGGIEVGVHIADVPYYIRRGSALDKEASRRGNSTYLVGTVIPMLPFELSNGICSLVEEKDRLVKSVLLTFDTTGELKTTRFANCVIRSNKRLSYEQAYAFLKEDDMGRIKNMPSPPNYSTGHGGMPLSALDDKTLGRLRTMIRQLWGIASTLRKRRMKGGALNLETDEIKIYCDKDGYATRIERQKGDESHWLIEEFMLAANEAVAKFLYDNKIPFISRVHDDPDPEKLDELREYLAEFSIECGDLTRRAEVLRVLDEINRHPQSYVLKTEFLKSLKRAVYRASPDGHYGLNKLFYAHFTSPIRRYADLTVHRNMNFLMQSLRMPTAPRQRVPLISQAQLDGISEHISRTERNSDEAERESQKIKLMEFFERKSSTSESFEAIITDVTDYGFFVELTESGAYGFVHMHSLRDDIYRLSNDGHALIGRRRKKQYKVGGKVMVTVDSVDRFKRQIDFAIADVSGS